MATTLTIRDESTAPGGEDAVFKLEFESETITVKELIRARVYQEVDDYNRHIRAGKMDRFRGLVQPDQADRLSCR